MHVLLVIPRYVAERYDFYQFPIGFGYIAGSIRTLSFVDEIRGLNLNHFDDASKALMKELEDYPPDIVLTGGLSSHYSEVKLVLDIVRQFNPSAIRVVGNGVVSGDPDAAMNALDADFGVLGEGEETVIQLLEALRHNSAVDKIPGLIIRQGTKLIRTTERVSTRDLDSISYPDYDLFDLGTAMSQQTRLDMYFFESAEGNQIRSIDMITSRSCPFMCTFCFHPVGKTYRERSIVCVEREIIEYKKKYNINMIGILDELFSLKISRLFEFCEMIKPLNLKWMVQLHVRTARRDVLAAMKEAGCTYISYGIESMSPVVLRSMAKKSTTEEVQRALDLTAEAGIGIQGNLIFGDSAETLNTANESLLWWSKNRRYSIYLSRLQVYPGSPDYVMAIREGIIKNNEREEFIRTLPEELNISMLNDENYKCMNFSLKVFGRSLLNIVFPSKFIVSSKKVNLRSAPVVSFSFSCVHCGYHNVYSEVNLRNEHQNYMRLTCTSCFLRSDVANCKFILENYFSNDHVTEDLPASQHLLGGGSNLSGARQNTTLGRLAVDQDRDLVGDCLNKLSGDWCWPEAALSPDTDEATYDKYLEFGAQLANRPFDVVLHLRVSDLLLKLGCGGSSLLHAEQAYKLVLSYTRIIDNPRINEILPGFKLAFERRRAQVMSEKSESIFLPNISNQPARFSDSNQRERYISKNEPNFPDFSHLKSPVVRSALASVKVIS
jgi:anaerobic magnesium-protoporphyrin IX monomethyl ester cyclase